jgi:hypothetical protein
MTGTFNGRKSCGIEIEKKGAYMKSKKFANTPVKKRKVACLKSLMEKIILQSLEDLWTSAERDECISFFRGERFGICADIAGMSLYEQAKLLNFANKIIDFVVADRVSPKPEGQKNKIMTFEALTPWNARISEIAATHHYPEVCIR